MKKTNKLEILELCENRVKFLLRDTKLALVNSLRRVMLAKIPTMAIHTVNITLNTSIATHNFLVHRLNMIPFDSQGVDQYKWTCECTCKGKRCVNCAIEYNIDVKNDTDDLMTVTSDHLVPKNPTSVKPIQYKNKRDVVTIVTLAPQQQFQAQVFVQKGIGKEDAKWMPVTICAFTNDREIVLNQDLARQLNPKKRAEFVKSCPMNVFADDMSVANPRNCTLCDECVLKAKTFFPTETFVEFKDAERDFIFTVECNGTLTPQVVVCRALALLREECGELEAELNMQ